MATLNFKVFGYEFGFYSSIRKSRNTPVEAITNRCKDGKYVIFLDYDNREWAWVKDELKAISEEYRLSEFYVFESSKNSYHAVCFDKLEFMKYVEILNRSSVDPHYRKVPFTFGKRLWTLRYTKKNSKAPTIRNILPRSKYAANELSQAHIELFSNIYDIPKPKGVYDGITGENSLIYAEYRI